VADVDWAALAATVAAKFTSIAAIKTTTADVKDALPASLPAAIVLPPAFELSEEGGIAGYETYTARFPFVVVFAATAGVEATMTNVYAVLKEIPAVFRAGRTLGGAAISSSLTHVEPDQITEWGEPSLPGIRGEALVNLHVAVTRSA
jgi:hypothetical protein